ncbi:hypothetical protein TNCV_4072961 [Trichonephila clavipes]|uniref:Uncharacterized protein n=1 Tax=Trichonephila clavipes TaxID=2585209 RepID=A0A8X6W817_TRICX|nr:hypothetical protein TNCV_4072961 [Trichonephila clavipes]
MRVRAYCAHPSIRDHWTLRCMSRCPDQVVSLKRYLQCLSPQASLVVIYGPAAVEMKGWVDLFQPGNRTQICGEEA